MNRFRRISLYSFIGFLSLTALLGVITVLKGDFDEFDAKTLGTTMAIAAASICAMCCSAFGQKRGQQEIALGGASLAVVAAVLAIVGIWVEVDAEGYWKTTAIFAVFAVASAHALVLGVADLKPSHRWVQFATGGVIFFIALIITGILLAEVDDEGVIEVVAVLAILDALGTLTVPILHYLYRAGGARETLSGDGRLTLNRREDGLYVDGGGAVYEVKAARELGGKPAAGEGLTSGRE
jgi:hypothetical protein